MTTNNIIGITKMQQTTMIIFSVLGGVTCVLLLLLGYKIIRERYTLLRHVGDFPQGLVDQDEHMHETVKRKPLYKKFLRHKYSKGTAYDRAKLRVSNRHGRYY